MKSSEILRKAARLVEHDLCIGGCYAICIVGWNADEESINRAKKAFKVVKPSKTTDGYWWPKYVDQGPRIIGLCLAAAIAESEGD